MSDAIRAPKATEPPWRGSCNDLAVPDATTSPTDGCAQLGSPVASAAPPAVSASSALDPAPEWGVFEGDVLGRYRLVRELGRGANGQVWEALDPALDVRVAIKVLATDSSPKSTERLLREARAAARLRHEAIVRATDFGAHDGRPYLVLEHLEGQTLEAYVRGNGAIDAIDAARLMLPLLDGLDTAHRAGVVHRDIKPDNIFLTSTATGILPKLLDFGVAVDIRGAEDRLTAGGTLIGTPAFMSPEQALGRADVDGRADVWGMAVTFYECISQREAFPCTDLADLLNKVLTVMPPSFAGISGADDALFELFERALAKDREERFPSARAFGEALAAWLSGHGIAEDCNGRSLAATWGAGPVSSLSAATLTSIYGPDGEVSSIPRGPSSGNIVVTPAPPRSSPSAPAFGPRGGVFLSSPSLSSSPLPPTSTPSWHHETGSFGATIRATDSALHHLHLHTHTSDPVAADPTPPVALRPRRNLALAAACLLSAVFIGSWALYPTATLSAANAGQNLAAPEQRVATPSAESAPAAPSQVSQSEGTEPGQPGASVSVPAEASASPSAAPPDVSPIVINDPAPTTTALPKSRRLVSRPPKSKPKKDKVGWPTDVAR
jgi:eukaryotic-like serine/threonine-protein kinase